MYTWIELSPQTVYRSFMYWCLTATEMKSCVTDFQVVGDQRGESCSMGHFLWDAVGRQNQFSNSQPAPQGLCNHLSAVPKPKLWDVKIGCTNYWKVGFYPGPLGYEDIREETCKYYLRSEQAQIVDS
ncbi:hypothetical protein T439DRAFT_331974 [Meredithblackwellia eburnea MCA 4105]